MLQIVVLQLLILLVSSKEIPSYITVCSRNDPKINECIINDITEIGKYAKKGIPGMNVPSLEPLYIPSISVDTDGSSVKIHADLTECVLHNITSVNMTYMKADPSNAKFSGTLYFPTLKIDGNYYIKGHVLNFEIQSRGTLDFDAKPVTVDIEWYGSFYTKNGNKHLIIDKVETKTEIKEMRLYLYNLFDNNEMLTNTVNGIINDNIFELKKDLNDIIEKTISETAIGYFNRVYELFTFDELYPE